MHMEKGKLAFGVIGTGIIVYIIFRFFFWLLFPVLFAIGVGKMLSPIVCYLERKCHFPDFLSVVLPVILFFGVLAVVVYYFVVSFFGQLMGLLEQFPSYEKWFLGMWDQMCSWCDKKFFMEQGTAFSYTQKQIGNWCQSFLGDGVAAFTSGIVGTVRCLCSGIGIVGVIFILCCLYIKSREEIQENIRNNIFYEDLKKILKPLTNVGFAYIRAQVIIISIVSVVCSIGFYFVGSSYGLVFGILVAVIDAFPILGSGLVLIPAAIVAAFTHRLKNAVIFLLLLLACQVVRQFLEPKLIGEKVGISPFFILLSVYFGLQLFGVIGVITGPMALVLWQSMVRYLRETVLSSCG